MNPYKCRLEYLSDNQSQMTTVAGKFFVNCRSAACNRRRTKDLLTTGAVAHCNARR